VRKKSCHYFKKPKHSKIKEKHPEEQKPNRPKKSTTRKPTLTPQTGPKGKNSVQQPVYTNAGMEKKTCGGENVRTHGGGYLHIRKFLQKKKTEKGGKPGR